MLTMCMVPLAFIVTRWFAVRRVPPRYQVMVGEGSPEALQWRVSEAMLMSAFLAKTTMSSGSSMNLGDVPETIYGGENVINGPLLRWNVINNPHTSLRLESPLER